MSSLRLALSTSKNPLGAGNVEQATVFDPDNREVVKASGALTQGDAIMAVDILLRHEREREAARERTAADERLGEIKARQEVESRDAFKRTIGEFIEKYGPLLMGGGGGGFGGGDARPLFGSSGEPRPDLVAAYQALPAASQDQLLLVLLQGAGPERYSKVVEALAASLRAASVPPREYVGLGVVTVAPGDAVHFEAVLEGAGGWRLRLDGDLGSVWVGFTDQWGRLRSLPAADFAHDGSPPDFAWFTEGEHRIGLSTDADARPISGAFVRGGDVTADADEGTAPAGGGDTSGEE